VLIEQLVIGDDLRLVGDRRPGGCTAALRVPPEIIGNG